jgi:acetyltransferase-like isoleucine patch superfamily enzyme
MSKSILSFIEKIVKFMFRNLNSYIIRFVQTTKSFLTYIKLKSNGVQFSKGVLGNSFYVNNKGRIILGQNVYLNSFPNGSMHRTALSTYYSNSVIIVGDNCRLNGTIIHCNERIEIGKNCLFGPGTVILDNDSHQVVRGFTERRKIPISRPVSINDNVWIGMNCTILKGVTIGENSIVAAGSIITKSIPENSLYGGNPAKVIKVIP